MRYVRSFNLVLLCLMALISVAIGYSIFTAINGIVAEQSRLQQESISPVLTLVNKELSKPLYISEGIAKARYFKELMNSEDIDEQAVYEHLASLEREFDLTFFIASEKARKQYFSNGRSIDLVEGKVAWYFQAIAEDKDIVADLGQVGDVHLYFDVRIFSDEGEFLGFVGIGKSLKVFLTNFQQYKQQYGYDMLFVDEDNRIMLSSKPDLQTTGAEIPELEDLAWFRNINPSSLRDGSLNSKLIQINENDFLISEFVLEDLSWKLLLLIPLHDRQSDLTRTFMSSSLIIIGLLAAIFGLVYLVLVHIKRRYEANIDIDALTNLPNRARLARHFNSILPYTESVGVVLLDIDHLNTVNETYGYDAGDTILKDIADMLRDEAREQDVVARWGGEEFVILVPGADEKAALGLAQRVRNRLVKSPFECGSATVSVTASFGVAYSSTRHTLSQIIAVADEALYRAKRDGRNKVEYCHYDERTTV